MISPPDLSQLRRRHPAPRPPGDAAAGPRAASSSSRGCATTRATGTTTPKSPPTCSTRVVQYTTIPVYPEEIVITADSPELLAFPFLFMTGHKLVRFSAARARRARPLRRARRPAVLRRLQSRRRRPVREVVRGGDAPRVSRRRPRCAKIPNSHRAVPIVLHVSTARRRPRTSSTAGATTWCTTTCAASNATAASA